MVLDLRGQSKKTKDGDLMITKRDIKCYDSNPYDARNSDDRIVNLPKDSFCLKIMEISTDAMGILRGTGNRHTLYFEVVLANGRLFYVARRYDDWYETCK